MFRLTITRAMHDRKIPNITKSRVLPPVMSSYDSPKKFDQHKPIREEPTIWKRLWPKFRVYSQQYRGYKATHGDGRPIGKKPHVFDVEDKLWTSEPERPKPHEHAEAEEEAIWGEINHDYTNIDGVESELKGEALASYKKLFKGKTT